MPTLVVQAEQWKYKNFTQLSPDLLQVSQTKIDQVWGLSSRTVTGHRHVQSKHITHSNHATAVCRQLSKQEHTASVVAVTKTCNIGQYCTCSKRGTHGLKPYRPNGTNRLFWQINLVNQPNSYLVSFYLDLAFNYLIKASFSTCIYLNGLESSSRVEH